MSDQSYNLTAPKPKKIDHNIDDCYKVWPGNVYYSVFGKACGTVPDDAEEAIEHLFKTTSRNKEIFYARFKDCKTYASIGRDFGLTSSRINQIISKEIRKLRHPSRIEYLRDLKGHIDRVKAQEAAFQEERKRQAEELQNKMKDIATIYTIHISELNLSTRVYNCLINSGIKTIGDIVETDISGLLKIRNVNYRSIAEIVSECKRFGVLLED